MGAECCESKSNLKDINSQPNNNNNNYQFTQTNKYGYLPAQDAIEKNNYTEPKGLLDTKELETKSNEIHSNIDRHVSLGSSIKNDNSSIEDSREQILDTKNTKNYYSENNINLSREQENINAISTTNDYIINSVPINNSNISQNIRDEGDYVPFKCVQSFQAHQEKIVSLIELHDGKIATGSYDSTIKVWNLEKEECEKTINEIGYVLCLLEFKDNMILSGTNENSIQLWDINNNYSNQSLFVFQGHELWVNCLVKCNDIYFASCSNDTDIRIWDYNSRKCTNILKGHEDCVLTLIMLKNGKLCSGSADLTIKIWNWEYNTCDDTLTGHTKWVKCVFQLNNGYLLSGSDDKTIKIWDENNNFINTLEGHMHSVRAICQINDELFASASFDKTIKIWNSKNWQNVQTLIGHNLNVISILYHSSGSLISASNDQYVKIWKNE